MAYNQKPRGGGNSSTAWSKQKPGGGGFYLSETIATRQRQPQTSQKTSGRNAKLKTVKSKEVSRLEELIDTLERGIPEDAGGRSGCFCLAQVHELSSYTPICPHCGLLICLLQAPASPCPHCFSPLLSSHERSQLIARLQSDITDVIKDEERKREEERLEQTRSEEARAGGGAFPTLAHSNAGNSLRGTPPPPATSNTPHKVLSLNSKTKKVTVSSYKPIQQQPTPPSVTPTPEEQAERERLKPIPPPPEEIDHPQSKPPDNRPFLNLRSTIQLTYISVKGKQTSNAEINRNGDKRTKRRRRSTLSKPQGVPPEPSSQEQAPTI